MIEFTWFDLMIVALFGLSTFLGVYRGLVRESYTLIVWTLAFIIAMVHGSAVGEMFSVITSPLGQKVLGMIILFITVLLVGFVVKLFLFKTFNIGKPGGLGRTGGAIFGILRAYIIVAVICAFIAPTKMADDKAYQDSQLEPYFQDLVDFLAVKIPPKWQHKKTNDETATDTTAATAIIKPIEQQN